MKDPAKQTRRTEVQIRALLNLYDEKNSTVTEFCHLHKIHKANFYNWRNKYGIQIERPGEFIPVQFNPSVRHSELFAEIELASKVVVRLYQRVDASYFKELLKR